MKKYFFLIVLCTYFAGSSNAQSDRETAEWLQWKVPMYCLKPEFSPFITITPHSFRQAEKVLNGSHSGELSTFEFKDLKAISLIYQKESSTVFECHKIIFTGKFGQIKLNLKPDIPEKDLNGIMKALKHLAELNGAKLIDEDLFK